MVYKRRKDVEFEDILENVSTIVKDIFTLDCLRAKQTTLDNSKIVYFHHKELLLRNT